ncbi:MAG: cell division protein FtsZ [Candidatus Micrarchaeota archaeon]|nr:cell division protein FtsZ [Candidatus Micrarchaeota archaeon]
MEKNFEQLMNGREYLVQEPGKPLTDEEKEILAVLEASHPRIYVIGTGGSGCNTINRMTQIGIKGATLVAMNTDAQHLLRIKADKRMLLGKKKTKGLGAGSNPAVGEAAAQESQEEIKQLLSNADLVFVTGGMGGGTGTGSAHVIAKIAKDLGALCVGVVTMPFYSEGPKRLQNAIDGLEKLKRNADTVIAVPNDKLLMFVPDLPLNAAFKVADSVLTNAVKGITELITKPGLVNLDFADMRTILEHSGDAVIGLGEVSNDETKDRLILAAEKALASPLLDVDIKTADRVLLNITGGSSMTLGEAEAAVNAIASKVAKDAHIIWGATIDDSMDKGGVKVLAVLAGIKGGSKSQSTSAEEAQIDLDFV